MNYRETLLWKNSIDNADYENDDLRENLSQNYDRCRENARFVLEKIRNDFSSLTVHDITHVDSLWQVGSVITGREYLINPLEGFVLGCAFLMHDAVLSYYAAGGQDKLRETIEWKDYYSDYRKRENLTEEERLYEADFCTIRLLHAKYAEQLHNQLFEREDGSRFYIIENESLRNHLGEIICKIAASHHWSIDQVEKLGCQIPAILDFPQEWRINPLKLACILRCADAGHMDAGRAPDYMLKLLEINGVSKHHWIAQNRLSQIDIDVKDENNVIIRSNIKFSEDEFAAWNVAYDAVCVLDHELKVSNTVLRQNGIKEFQAHGVSGADSQEHLCQYIETDGWMPCNASVHISNIESLINNLGGEKLYGSEHKIEIILRELIQNGRDAVSARRSIEKEFDGEINVTIEEQDNKIWVSVKDNGVGMSLQSIKDYLLNFGSSFWASDLAKKEFPGLNSSGYKSVGQFGIGFYSVFMVSEEVIVETRKYDKGLDDTYVLKFPKGFCLRPTISKTKSQFSKWSTVVRFSIDESKVKWNRDVKITPGIYGEEPFVVPFSAVLSNLTAGLDVDVYYKELQEDAKIIHHNFENMEIGSEQVKEWLKEITYANYHGGNFYTEYIDLNYKRLKKIYSKGECCGLAALNTLWQSRASFFSVITVGGLTTFSIHNDEEFIGCIWGEPDTAKRDGNIKKIDKREWAAEQYNILVKNGLSDLDRIRLPYVLGQYGIDMTEEIIVRFFDKKGKVYSGSIKDYIKLVKEKNKKLVFGLSNISVSDRIENYLDYDKSRELLKNDEFLFIVENNTNFLNLKYDDVFPLNLIECFRILARKLSINLCEEFVEEKAFACFGGICRAFILSAK